LSAFVFCAFVVPAALAGPPVLSGYPGCEYDRLGTVQVTAGRRPDGTVEDNILRLVDYARTFDRLSAAAEARGANAAVVNLHEAAFYTRASKRSKRPVYLSLTAAAIRLRDPAHCEVAVMEPAAMEARAQHGDVQNVTIQQPPAAP
jgi:hypothetical protein